MERAKRFDTAQAILTMGKASSGAKEGFRPRPVLSLSPSMRRPRNRGTHWSTTRGPIPTMRFVSVGVLPSDARTAAQALRAPPRRHGGRAQPMEELMALIVLQINNHG